MLHEPSYRSFHASSSIEGRHMAGETWTDPSTWPKEWTEISLKSYPRFPSIALPRDSRSLDVSLDHVLRSRCSTREPTVAALETEDLSLLLERALGFRPAPDALAGARRFYPSAGARFPLETYVLALRCSKLDCGAYHYDPRGHRLERLCMRPMQDAARQIFGHEWIARSRVVLVMTSEMPRTSIKYGERGYRFALFEAGHAVQNVCLVAAALAVAATPVGGFADRRISRLLDIDGDDEIPLYSVVLP